jgi:hypothetical protein
MRNDAGEEASAAALELVRLALGHGSRSGRTPTIWYPTVRAALATDGWEYDQDSKRLVPTVPDVQVAEETSLLQEQIRSGDGQSPPGTTGKP